MIRRSLLKTWVPALAGILAIFTFYFAESKAAGIAQQNPQQNYSNFVIARVNSKVITYLELMDRYQFVLFASKINAKSIQDRKIILNQIMDKMIDEELIRQEAANLKIEATADEIQGTIDDVAAQQRKNATQFKLALAQKNISVTNYVRQVEADILWSKLISEMLRPKIKITDAEIQEFFEQQKFNTNISKLFIAEIFIPKAEKAGEISTKLVSELRNGADFRSIVKQFSRDSLSVENNGEIGWVSQKDLDKKIYDEVSKLKKGEYSNPVLLADGYYIYKLINTKFETKIEDQDLNVARNNIFIKKLQNLARGYLMDLKKKSFVEVDREKIGL